MITPENYFSVESDTKYMSTSQFKDFYECEARAKAKLNGDWEQTTSKAMLIGSYIDAHFEGTLDLFKAQTPELFKKNGDLYAEFEFANDIIKRIERDELFNTWAMHGEKQVIKVGEIAGVPFKTKMDCYKEGEAIIDLKIVRDFSPVWIEGRGKFNFIEAWGYDLQGAIYQAVEGNNLPFIIAAATKEKPEPDIAIMNIPNDVLGISLGIVKQNAPRFQAIKEGKEKPTRCERCDYCKHTRVLTEVKDYRDVVFY